MFGMMDVQMLLVMLVKYLVQLMQMVQEVTTALDAVETIVQEVILNCLLLHLYICKFK